MTLSGMIVNPYENNGVPYSYGNTPMIPVNVEQTSTSRGNDQAAGLP